MDKLTLKKDEPPLKNVCIKRMYKNEKWLEKSWQEFAMVEKPTIRVC
jgi:hypothetical protein